MPGSMKISWGRVDMLTRYLTLRNMETSNEEYIMSIADMIINNVSWHKVINFLDWDAGNNQIFMPGQDRLFDFSCKCFLFRIKFAVEASRTDLHIKLKKKTQ